MEKIITNELITEKLEAKGIMDYTELSHEVMLTTVKNHSGFTIDHDWRLKHYDAYFYTETTAAAGRARGWTDVGGGAWEGGR